MNRLEVTTAYRQAMDGNSAPGVVAHGWQPGDGSISPFDVRHALILAQDKHADRPGSVAKTVVAAVVEALEQREPDEANDLDGLAPHMFDALLAIDEQLRASQETCSVAVVAFRPDGFVLGCAGEVGAWHLRAARVHDLGGPATNLLGDCEQSDIRLGVGDATAGDRIILGSSTLAAGALADQASFVRAASLTDLATACNEVSALAASKGLPAPLVAIAQVRPARLPAFTASDREADSRRATAAVVEREPEARRPMAASATVIREGAPAEATHRPAPRGGERDWSNPIDKLGTLSLRTWTMVAVVCCVLALLVGYALRKAATNHEPAAPNDVVVSAPPITSVPPALTNPATVPAAPVSGATVTGGAGGSAAPPPPTGAPLTTSVPPTSGPNASAAPSTGAGAATPPVLAETPATTEQPTGGPATVLLRPKANTVRFGVNEPASMTVTGLGDYKVENDGSAYVVTLRSAAGGQRYRLEAADGAKTTLEGRFDDLELLRSQLKPGKYRLVMGTNTPIAEIEVSAAAADAGTGATTSSTP